MKVKNLVLVNTRLIIQTCSVDNFNTLVRSKPGGYRILEKKYIKTDYSILKQKKYFIPGTNEAVDKFFYQKTGQIYRDGIVLPLRFFTSNKDLSKEEIKVLEKKINEKRK